MKNLICLTFLLFFLTLGFTYAQTQNIYIAPNGSDTAGSGITTAPYKSLERALEDVVIPLQKGYNLILKHTTSGYIQHTKNNIGQLLWTKSGSQQYPALS